MRLVHIKGGLDDIETVTPIARRILSLTPLSKPAHPPHLLIAMFARVAAVSTLAFAALAAAQSCNTGPIQCCNSVESVSGQFFLHVL